MRIAVSAYGTGGLDSPVCQHFGKCESFVVVDTDQNGTVVSSRTLANPVLGNHSCSGVTSFVGSTGAQVVVVGGIGAGAVHHLESMGVRVATGASGTVQDAIKDCLEGRLSGAEQCCTEHDEACH